MKRRKSAPYPWEEANPYGLTKRQMELAKMYAAIGAKGDGQHHLAPHSAVRRMREVIKLLRDRIDPLRPELGKAVAGSLAAQQLALEANRLEAKVTRMEAALE